MGIDTVRNATAGTAIYLRCYPYDIRRMEIRRSALCQMAGLLGLPELGRTRAGHASRGGTVVGRRRQPLPVRAGGSRRAAPAAAAGSGSAAVPGAAILRRGLLRAGAEHLVQGTVLRGGQRARVTVSGSSLQSAASRCSASASRWSTVRPQRVFTAVQSVR